MPTTDEGKLISSRNAIRHGCCADSALILPSENIADYKALEATWFHDYNPQSNMEKHLVQDAVNAGWFYQRAVRTVARLEAQFFESSEDPLSWTEDQHRALARFQRYQTTRANNANRARKALESYRKDRTAEKQAEQKSAIALQRLEVYKEKNKPEPSIQDLIQDLMVKKAEKDSLLAEENNL